ncbi:MAG: sulfatase-like hydrolase/transferase [Pseudomonadota bacterium]
MKQKNVLIICSDEHARSVLGCYGHSVVQTPTLDKLAGQGVRFTRAYTPSPICISARASIATGTQVHEHGCWSSAEPYYGQHESWMHRLRERDHAVVSIGKLHFRSGRDDNGFSEEILPMYLANDGRGWPQGLIREPLGSFDEASELAKEAGPGESTYTEYDRDITAEACRWLRRYPKVIKNKPWALFVSLVSPHFPLTAPQAFFDLYEGQPLPETIAPGPAGLPDHPVIREMVKFWSYDDYFDDHSRYLGQRAYFGLCSFLDDNIRQVLAALEDSGAARDTVILYISDHGEMLGNHGFWAKSLMYEDSVGIPLIMAGEDLPVSVNDTPVSLTDLAATVEDIVGVERAPAEEPWQSRSLRDIAARPDPGRFILSQYHDGGSPTGFYMIRHDRWKYVYYAGREPSQLFDMEADPHELADLGEDRRYERERETMHKLLTSILDPDEENRRVFADQARMLESYGGAAAVMAMPSFNHTPLGG